MAVARLRVMAALTLAVALLASLLVRPDGVADAAEPTYGVDRACPDGTAPAAGFSDGDGVHAAGIRCLVWFDVVEGRTSARFGSHDELTRGQAASMLANLLVALDGVPMPERASGRFDDIGGTMHQGNIERLAGFDPPVLRGYDADTFAPDRDISRAQFASVIVGLLDAVAGRSQGIEPLPAVSGQRYHDVPAGSVHADSIARLTGAGLIVGRSEDGFDPASPLERGQAATIVARLLGGLVDAGLAVRPAEVVSVGRWTPGPGTTWHWQLQGSLDLDLPVQAYDIDGFDTSPAVVEELNARGRGTICYLSAGSWEEWRPDADRFPEAVLGSSNGWPGERWLDIRRLDLLGPIMTERMRMCADKGFDAVEPDNVDGFSNDTGFPLTAQDQLRYNRWLAQTAHELGLAVGLKNDVEQAAALEPHFDFAVNESCFRWNECDRLDVFIDADKAVFNVEYDIELQGFCAEANRKRFSSMRKDEELDAWAATCWD